MTTLVSKAFTDVCESEGIDLTQYTYPLDKEKFPNFPTEKYAHFIVNLELKDFTIFTQDGQTLLVAETKNGDKTISRGVMFQRKGRAALRRKFMSILRTYGLNVMNADNLSTTEIRQINRLTPDSSVFGFAVGDADDNKRPIAFAGKSRLLTGSSFTIRPLSQKICNYITFNSQSDKTRIEEPSNALGEKENILPEIIFPMILSLKNPTIEDIHALTYTIDKVNRVGASSNVGGVAKMHLLGLYFSHEEFPSNLEISQNIYTKLDDKDVLKDVNTLTIECINALQKENHIKSQFVSSENVFSIYSDIFESESSIKKWFNTYSIEYYEILATIDAYNKFPSKKGKMDSKLQNRLQIIADEKEKLLV